ncbi:MAG: glycosyltransferase family 4 protein [Candidatus Roizmanbacteria bacterium]|nr:glycosyltransferase family 4 protein [Candidatus Roizmanbacteria bacterium]
MKISFVRGAFLNNFEGQNYPLNITGYSSLFPIDSHVQFPLIKLPSLADFQRLSFLNKPIKYIANRTIGDSQVLFGLENHIVDSDIVHVGDPHYYYSYQVAVLRSKGLIKKLISTWWETIPFNNESTTAKKRIKEFTMQYVDRFVCYTGKAKQCLITEGVNANKISLIPLGVDVSLFYPASKKESKPFTILFVGRLVEEKGVMDLYNAFKKVIATTKDIRLHIVGQGPLENTLRKLIQDVNLQNSVTIEHKSYKEIPTVFQQADVFCVPSKKTTTWEEQYGMVFIEAMASGLPIVSTKSGAIADVVQDAGILTEEGNEQELAQSITDLYTNKQLCSKLGTIGRERAEKVFNAHNTRKLIEELYVTI